MAQDNQTREQMGVFDTMFNCRAMRRLDTREAVSYTHLTLPTIYSV